MLAAGFVLGGVAVSVASVYASVAASAGGLPVAAGREPSMAGIGTNQNILAYTLTLSLCGALRGECRAAHGHARPGWLPLGVIGYGMSSPTRRPVR